MRAKLLILLFLLIFPITGKALTNTGNDPLITSLSISAHSDINNVILNAKDQFNRVILKWDTDDTHKKIDYYLINFRCNVVPYFYGLDTEYYPKSAVVHNKNHYYKTNKKEFRWIPDDEQNCFCRAFITMMDENDIPMTTAISTDFSICKEYSHYRPFISTFQTEYQDLNGVKLKAEILSNGNYELEGKYRPEDIWFEAHTKNQYLKDISRREGENVILFKQRGEWSGNKYSVFIPYLKWNSDYCYRSVASNSMGITYSSVLCPGKDNVYLAKAYPSGVIDGYLNGRIINTGGDDNVIAWFVYYEKGSKNVISTKKQYFSKDEVVGKFYYSQSISDLLPSTTYCYKSYTRNEAGFFVSPEKCFSTQGKYIETYDVDYKKVLDDTVTVKMRTYESGTAYIEYDDIRYAVQGIFRYKTKKFNVLADRYYDSIISKSLIKDTVYWYRAVLEKDDIKHIDRKEPVKSFRFTKPPLVKTNNPVEVDTDYVVLSASSKSHRDENDLWIWVYKPTQNGVETQCTCADSIARDINVVNLFEGYKRGGQSIATEERISLASNTWYCYQARARNDLNIVGKGECKKFKTESDLYNLVESVPDKTEFDVVLNTANLHILENDKASIASSYFKYWLYHSDYIIKEQGITKYTIRDQVELELKQRMKEGDILCFQAIAETLNGNKQAEVKRACMSVSKKSKAITLDHKNLNQKSITLNGVVNSIGFERREGLYNQKAAVYFVIYNQEGKIINRIELDELKELKERKFYSKTIDISDYNEGEYYTYAIVVSDSTYINIFNKKGFNLYMDPNLNENYYGQTEKPWCDLYRYAYTKSEPYRDSGCADAALSHAFVYFYQNNYYFQFKWDEFIENNEDKIHNGGNYWKSNVPSNFSNKDQLIDLSTFKGYGNNLPNPYTTLYFIQEISEKINPGWNADTISKGAEKLKLGITSQYADSGEYKYISSNKLKELLNNGYVVLANTKSRFSTNNHYIFYYKYENDKFYGIDSSSPGEEDNGFMTHIFNGTYINPNSTQYSYILKLKPEKELISKSYPLASILTMADVIKKNNREPISEDYVRAYYNTINKNHLNVYGKVDNFMSDTKKATAWFEYWATTGGNRKITTKHTITHNELFTGELKEIAPNPVLNGDFLYDWYIKLYIRNDHGKTTSMIKRLYIPKN